jgi:hypothetical protein
VHDKDAPAPFVGGFLIRVKAEIIKRGSRFIRSTKAAVCGLPNGDPFLKTGPSIKINIC